MSNFEAENTELVCNVWIRNTDLSSCNLMFRCKLDCSVALREWCTQVECMSERKYCQFRLFSSLVCIALLAVLFLVLLILEANALAIGWRFCYKTTRKKV